MKVVQPIPLCSVVVRTPIGKSQQRAGEKQIMKSVGLIVFLCFSCKVQALSLSEMLRASVEAHPTIMAARQGVNAANDDVDVARRRYWPTFSASLESGTTNSVETPTRLLRAEQTLWDFGLTSATIRVSERAADVASAALDAQRQNIGLQVIDALRALQAGYGRIRVSEEMLKSLELNESMMMRRVAGELSTNIDLDLVRSRILQGRVELTQAQTSVQVSITKLQNLTGLKNLKTVLSEPPLLPSKIQLEKRSRLLVQTDWDVVANRQPAVLRAVEELRQGNERINVKVAESRPQIYARLDQAINNRRDTAAYIGLRYSTGAGFANLVEERALASRALALEQMAQAARIEARQVLDVDVDDLRDNGLRAQSLDAAVKGAQRVFESYERQFAAGRKTWLDLMNALREVAQNSYSLVDANAAQAAALYRLQLRVDPELIDVAVGTESQLSDVAEKLKLGVQGNAGSVSNSLVTEGEGAAVSQPVSQPVSQSALTSESLFVPSAEAAISSR
ncbi:TolC family protein [Variovorax sp. RHLX14]|uniref:TolC family protein n=1 Tax=Variovorax sp. RHLX14 TaxID=1259731 RepID=UPI003F47CF81